MVLHSESISFSYSRSRPVLSGVTAAFAPGRVTAIIGPNGAGKTTLLRVLLGLARPRQGRVTLDGDRVEGMNASQRAARLAYVPQHPSVGFAYSTREVIGLGRVAIRRSASGAGDDSAIIDGLLRDFELTDLARRAFTELSAGQRQRATLARAFAQLGVRGDAAAADRSASRLPMSARMQSPALQPAADGTRALLADEPFSAMDPRHAVRCAASVRAAAAAGIAVVLVLHDLAAVAGIADDVVVLGESGVLAATGEVSGVLAGPLLRRVYGVEFERDAAPDGSAVYRIPWPGAAGKSEADAKRADAAPPVA
jgi:iron complex transport system ATP-binding protein